MSNIKMSDMFAVDIQAKQIHIKGGYTYSKISGMTTEEYAARAINTHDTLVAQNLALKAALEDISALTNNYNVINAKQIADLALGNGKKQ